MGKEDILKKNRKEKKKRQQQKLHVKNEVITLHVKCSLRMLPECNIHAAVVTGLVL